MGAEGRQRLLDALLVANVGVDAIQQRKLGLLRGNMQSGVGHQGQQSHRFESDGFPAGIGPGDYHHVGRLRVSNLG